MKNRLQYYWNLRPLGFFKFIGIISKVVLTTIIERVSSFFWRFNFEACGNNIIIQKGTNIRHPKNITLGNNVSIGRNVEIFTEFNNSLLNIGDYSQINKGVELDYSGGLTIGENVVISENSILMSHDHGLNPKSKPIKKPKAIHDNVWIGSNCIILSQVSSIGTNSIVAAGSVVTKDVPANVIVAGNPAKVIKHLI